MLRLDLNSENTEVSRLCENVYELGGRQDVHIINGNAFSHEVEVDLDVLGALVLNGVSEEVDDADVIAIDECTLREWCVKFLK
jgi:hypothetical protein